MSEVTGPTRGRAGGFSDWIGQAAARRRAITSAFLDTFEAWGYSYVATPLVEPLDTVAAGVGGSQQAQLFRFMDGDGSLLALVGERTVSVARVVATQLQRGPFPLRLCYAGPVLFNRPLLGGRRRETVQAGCELIGHAGLAADAECIAVAAAALERAGIAGAQIDVGHADFIPSLLDSAGLGRDSRTRVAEALRRRDLVAVEECLAGTDVAEAERALLLAFPTLRGGREILESAGQQLTDARPHAVLADLARLWSMLDRHGITDRVHLDLGAVRDWDYYTGPTFELFSADLGFPLGSGGRYDRLLAAFGLESPATGFVLHVDRCCDALMRRDGAFDNATPLRMAYGPDQARTAFECASRLRDAGFPVALDLDPSAQVTGERSAFVAGQGAVAWRIDGQSGQGGFDGLLTALRGAGS